MNNQKEVATYLSDKKISKSIKTHFEELGKESGRQDCCSSFSDLLLQRLSESVQATDLLASMLKYDEPTFIHSLSVTFYTMLIAQAIGMRGDELSEIGLGALLHDTGKIEVPVEILNKQEKLYDWEFEKIKEHSALGGIIIKKKETFSNAILACVEQHHERLDGKGYPNQLTEESIHPYAKIIAVADVYDALISDRPYRKAMSIQQAMSILKSGIGSQFKGELVRVLEEELALKTAC